MQRVFSFEIRLECIRLYEEENLSPGAIAKKIGTVHSVVERWLKLYKYNGIEGLKIKDYNQQYDDDLKSKVARDAMEFFIDFWDYEKSAVPAFVEYLQNQFKPEATRVAVGGCNVLKKM